MKTNPTGVDATPADGIPLGTGFQFVKRGYDPVEVQRFANACSAEMKRLVEQNRKLKAALDAKPAAPETVDEQSVAKFLGAETSKLLELARSTSAQVVSRAESKAKTILEEARVEAEEIRRTAESQANRLRSESERDAKSARSAAQAEREAVLQGLANRRDLANAQVLELVNGCDIVAQRLAEVEDMARYLLAKVGPIGAEPTDFVNLDIDATDDKVRIDRDSVLRLTVNGAGNGAG